MDMQYALREGVLTVRLFGELGHHEAIQGMARLAGLVEDLLPGGFLLQCRTRIHCRWSPAR